MSNVPLTAAERMEKIVSLCKRKGFIFQSSEIYGGFNGFWDYGPLGAELKRNLRERWWLAMTRDREDVVGLDATIVMHPGIWKASGHVDTFADSMRESTLSNKRVRTDHVEPQSGNVLEYSGARTATGWSLGKPIRVLLRKGEHIESLRKRVKTLLASVHSVSGEIELLDEQNVGAVENSVDFHAEDGGALGEARPFNLMMRTWVGPTATDADIAYLRPETAQAIFAQFKNVLDSSRVKVPFGICQIGKAFRNEVTPRNYTFRSREFEQMELEFFIRPDEAIEIIAGKVTPWTEGADLSTPQPDWGWQMWHRYWVAERTRFYQNIGLGDALEYYFQPAEDLAHYARACVDILFQFPFKTDELEGIAARGAFDLTQHQIHSGKPQEVFDDELKAAAAKLSPEQKEALLQKRLTEEKAKGDCGLDEAAVRAWFERLFAGFYVPHVIEPSAGLDRLVLAILCHAYAEESVPDAKGNPEVRNVLRFHPRIAPVKVAVLPLLRNKPELVAKARAVYDELRQDLAATFDDGGAIGRRYRRQDEVGTPFCVTIDFETLGEKGPELQDTVTLRHRDSMQQERIKISELAARLRAAVR
ncbi:MAG: glycine--tRNA ligase [Verrucomicrobia bacterium]|nr:glycine--tRNA ligase [Verrucomicrobiota bacterium]